MLESTTTSQSSTPTSYNVGNGAVTSSDGRWNQVDSINMLQNTTPQVWNELPPHSAVSVPVSTNNVSSDYHVTSSVNHVNKVHIISNQVVHPPNYMNMPYPSSQPQVWNELSPHSAVSVPVSTNNVSSDYHVTSSVNHVNKVNIISNQVVHPPNYMNMPYPRNSVSNGYASLNPTRGINPQIINGQNVQRTQNGQMIGGPGWNNQSAFGKFISQSPGWTSNKTTGRVKKQKRIRTAFTSQQMMELEQEYARSRYLDRARRIELAGLLRLNERTIKIWFQNRRMKEKKDRAESMEESEEASTSESSPEMNNIQMPMLIHEQYPGIKNEVYNQGNIYMEQYPIASTSNSMPATSLPTPIPVQSSVQIMYQNFMSEEESRAQYQQVNLQMQPYQAQYTEVQKMSPEVEPKEQPTTSSAPSEMIEKNWDLSWIRPFDYEENY